MLNSASAAILSVVIVIGQGALLSFVVFAIILLALDLSENHEIEQYHREHPSAIAYWQASTLESLCFEH